jgi:fructokinase
MILVCGEALIDPFVDAPKGAEMPASAVAGGSPFNLAIGLARLRVPSAFFRNISRDRFCALLADTLPPRAWTIASWSAPTGFRPSL